MDDSTLGAEVSLTPQQLDSKHRFTSDDPSNEIKVHIDHIKKRLAEDGLLQVLETLLEHDGLKIKPEGAHRNPSMKVGIDTHSIKGEPPMTYYADSLGLTTKVGKKEHLGFGTEQTAVLVEPFSWILTKLPARSLPDELRALVNTLMLFLTEKNRVADVSLWGTFATDVDALIFALHRMRYSNGYKSFCSQKLNRKSGQTISSKSSSVPKTRPVQKLATLPEANIDRSLSGTQHTGSSSNEEFATRLDIASRSQRSRSPDPSPFGKKRPKLRNQVGTGGARTRYEERDSDVEDEHTASQSEREAPTMPKSAPLEDSSHETLSERNFKVVLDKLRESIGANLLKRFDDYHDVRYTTSQISFLYDIGVMVGTKGGFEVFAFLERMVSSKITPHMVYIYRSELGKDSTWRKVKTPQIENTYGKTSYVVVPAFKLALNAAQMKAAVKYCLLRAAEQRKVGFLDEVIPYNATFCKDLCELCERLPPIASGVQTREDGLEDPQNGDSPGIRSSVRDIRAPSSFPTFDWGKPSQPLTSTAAGQKVELRAVTQPDMKPFNSGKNYDEPVAWRDGQSPVGAIAAELHNQTTTLFDSHNYDEEAIVQWDIAGIQGPRPRSDEAAASANIANKDQAGKTAKNIAIADQDPQRSDGPALFLGTPEYSDPMSSQNSNLPFWEQLKTQMESPPTSSSKVRENLDGILKTRPPKTSAPMGPFTQDNSDSASDDGSCSTQGAPHKGTMLVDDDQDPVVVYVDQDGRPYYDPLDLPDDAMIHYYRLQDVKRGLTHNDTIMRAAYNFHIAEQRHMAKIVRLTKELEHKLSIDIDRTEKLFQDCDYDKNPSFDSDLGLPHVEPVLNSGKDRLLRPLDVIDGKAVYEIGMLPPTRIRELVRTGRILKGTVTMDSITIGDLDVLDKNLMVLYSQQKLLRDRISAYERRIKADRELSKRLEGMLQDEKVLDRFTRSDVNALVVAFKSMSVKGPPKSRRHSGGTWKCYSDRVVYAGITKTVSTTKESLGMASPV